MIHLDVSDNLRATWSVGEGKVFQEDAARIERNGAGHSACSKCP